MTVRGVNRALCPPSAGERFSSAQLERIFAGCFASGWRTKLVGGADEPFYRPAAGPGDFHLLHYRSDYFASALHEVAHWCIAGEQRRQLADFGYWYAPDGRGPEQQQAFEAVEAAPQALEWYFSLACGYPFQVSADNLGDAGGALPDTTPFKRRILARARHWQSHGLPQRADLFFRALSRAYATGLQPAQLQLELAGLRG